MMQELECPIREAFVRVMRDAGGKMLPSEAAAFVGKMFKVPPVSVLLVIGRKQIAT